MNCKEIVSRLKQRKILVSIILIMITGCNSPQVKESKPSHQSIKSPEQICIERIIKEDESLGTIRNNACKNLPLSQSIKDYTEGIEKLNFENCREKFTRAFNKHKEAWTDMIPVTNNYPTLRGEMHDLFARLEKGDHAEEFKKRLKLITDTWTAVEKARKESR